MKTPEEIKKGQEQCIASKSCDGCPFEGDCYEIFSNIPMIKETFAYIQKLEADNASKDERIQMLEAGMAQWEDVAASPGAVEDMARENHRLTKELEAVKRERDAAVRAISDAQHYIKNLGAVQYGLQQLENWDYCINRLGVCLENTEAD